MNIDCEGGELIFLEENAHVIQNCNKILIEIHQFLMKDKKFKEKCINKIKSYGFTLVDSIDTVYFFQKQKNENSTL